MRLLVIDDDQGIRDFLKTSLESECYAVDTASDGEEGSFIARTNEYDIIILDINLPKKDGLEVCKEVRSEGNNVPIMMLSVQSAIPTKVELIEAGADDYLTKPFSYEELRARIKALLRRPAQIQGEIIRIGQLVIDTQKNEVRYGAEVIPLTRKEYMLLEYLARNAGKVLSRGAILEHVWDMNADPFSNTIEAHIRNLRRKIGQKARNKKIIRTLSGRGYMFDNNIEL